MTTALKWFSRPLPRSVVEGASGVFVMLVGALDYMTGIDVSVTLLYLLPVYFGTWFAGRRTGVFIACASALVWLVADSLGRTTLGHPFVSLWNTVTLGFGFVIVAYLLGALKDKDAHLEQMVLKRTADLRVEIGERVRTEGQLKETNVALIQAREQLQQSFVELQRAHTELQRTQNQLIQAAKMETVGRMAAGVAHEIKNPLMTLSLGADYFLSRKTENQDEAVLVQDMKEAVHRASRILNRLLDYSRPRPLQLVREDINALIENALTLVRHQLNQGRVMVVRELQAGLPPALLDRTRVEHVLVNLFINALQAMPAGGTLTVRTASTGPADSGDRSPDCLIVEIEDTGPGVAAENLSKLFEPFFTTKTGGQGTGLGLAIVRRIMEIHGGSVSLANREGGGARATLKFNTEPKGRL